MGQKIHPGGLRVGVIHDWKSNWMVGKKEFAGALIEDIKIREHILKKLSHAGLSDILIRKDKQRITIDIFTARPGIVIGKSGVEVDALRKEVHAMTQKNVHININEIKRPELDAKLVAQSIAEQLQNRVSFRRAMKRSLASAIRSGAAGVKVQCSGRLGNRPGAPRTRGGQRPGVGDRARGQDNVEQPRTDTRATSKEGREQPVIEPKVETTPQPVADAPDTTTRKTQHEDPTKLDKSGTKDEKGGSGAQPGSGSKGSKGGRS